MKYRIEFTEERPRPIEVDYMLDLLINNQRSSPLCTVLSYLTLAQIPQFLEDAIILQEKSTYYGGFFKGPCYEEEDYKDPALDIKADEIQISAGMDFQHKEIIKTDLFYEICLYYAHKALEAVAWFNLLEKKVVDQAWIDRIKNWIMTHENTILKISPDAPAQKMV